MWMFAFPVRLSHFSEVRHASISKIDFGELRGAHFWVGSV